MKTKSTHIRGHSTKLYRKIQIPRSHTKLKRNLTDHPHTLIT